MNAEAIIVFSLWFALFYGVGKFLDRINIYISSFVILLTCITYYKPVARGEIIYIIALFGFCFGFGLWYKFLNMLSQMFEILKNGTDGVSVIIYRIKSFLRSIFTITKSYIPENSNKKRFKEYRRENVRHYKQNKRHYKANKRHQEELRRKEQKLREEAERVNRYKQGAEEEIKRKQRQAEEDLKNFHRSQQQQNQSSTSSKSSSVFMPKTLAEAFQVLETTSGLTKDEYKKIYKQMMTKHHSDKVNHLGKSIQDLAKEQTKAIRQAWDIIERNL